MKMNMSQKQNVNETQSESESGVNLKCLRCQNEDQTFFRYHQRTWYCLKCMDFGLLPAGRMPKKPVLRRRVINTEPVLEFEMTPAQKQVSQKALSALQQGKDVFVFAATGCGKTEISLPAIAWYLNQGKKVCFAISRRQVVLEIAGRLRKNFPDLDVVEICQGYTQKTDGDLIVCTTHQLYRYPHCFDLLILDELDAFPFVGNPVLEAIADQSCIGSRMLLSATPDQNSLEKIRQGKMEVVYLFRRPHGKPLCVPKVKRMTPFRQVIDIIVQCHRFKKKHQQVLVFVPRRKDTVWMKWILSCFCRCQRIHSATKNRDAIMESFRNRESEVLVCTTLLERGITVPSVQVLVYKADHVVFTTASLIQIFGRVGRTFKDPNGMGICYIERFSPSVKECVRQLKWMNSTAANAMNPSIRAPQ